ncbi:uncharacterized protein LOC120678007 [Panicum virgatum]|uniref:uncharacterized protein LOC120678007 n=1 Tax=Panicum virgatum TaxID=38727 RepID=UPI0019D66DD0|nr:uncharacterized protein LOC120678007 [Panicum virgatum]
MVDSMLRDSPLPDTERSEERLSDGSGSDKLPEEEKGEKLPEGDGEKLPKEAPTGNTIARVEDAPQKAISDVRASTSQVSSVSVLPQEKLKLAYKLMGEVLGQEGNQAQDNTELKALKERVKTLSSEKAAPQEKLKKLSKAKKDEIEKLKKIKEDTDREAVTTLK